MFYKNFSDFTQFKHAGIEMVVFLTADMQLHIIDFKIESQLSVPQDLVILGLGISDVMKTLYNTLKYSKIQLYDLGTDKSFSISSSQWGEYFYMNDRGIITLYDDKYGILKISAEWSDPKSLFGSLLPKEINSNLKFIVTTSGTLIRRADLEENQYSYTVENLHVGSNNTITLVTLEGNIPQGFQESIKEVCKIDLKTTELDKLLSKRYPDITVKEGIPDIYRNALQIFNTY